VRYIYQPAVEPISFGDGMRALADRGYTVTAGPVDITAPETVARIRDLARQQGVTIEDYEIDPEGFRRYFSSAGYETAYADYYRANQIEKALEHYIALELLRPTRGDVFIDIASEHSPLADIASRLTSMRAFSQDIMYEDGVRGNRIGGDASAMPVADGFASKACLTCSLEHFEGDADTRLFRELARVLRPGGAVCVVPFYIAPEAASQTDPTISVPAGVSFDPGVPVFCAQGWGNRHGRFYSPESFVNRIVQPAGAEFSFRLFCLTNAATVDPSVYARFAFLATRT
jgi:SAM-dependent methyltransferase